jgi:hypothetical protein
MASQEILRRLGRLEYSARRQSQTGTPKRRLYFQKSSPAKERRLNQLWNQLEGELTDAEAEELYDLLADSIVFEEVENNNARRTSVLYNEDTRRRTTYVEVANSPDEIRLMITFHEFVRTYPAIARPYFMYAAEEYPLKTVRRLFEKYGTNEQNSKILPLPQWAAHDRTMLVELYRK